MSEHSQSTKDLAGTSDILVTPTMAGAPQAVGKQSRSGQSFPMDCACQASLRALRQRCLRKAESLRELGLNSRTFEVVAEWIDEIIDQNRTLVVSYRTAEAISQWSHGRIKNKVSDNSDPLENVGTSGNGMARVRVSDLLLTPKYAAMPHEWLREEIKHLESGESEPEEVATPREKATPPKKREAEEREHEVTNFKRGAKRSLETSSDGRLQLDKMLEVQ